MWVIHQFPLCPFSRKIRLLLAEKGIPFTLERVNPWERQDEFLDMNPAAQTPVVVEDKRGITLVDSRAISEYIEETVEAVPMLSGTATDRAEIRRLVAWLDEF